MSSEVDAAGVELTWTDADDRDHRLSQHTVDALHDLIGTPPEDAEDTAPVVTRPGRDLGLGRLEVRCEDGSERVVEGSLPEDFPLGYHRLRTSDGVERRLIVSPGRCWLPAEQVWGWAAQLYAARSSASWGIGDLGDLRTLRQWTERAGGGFLLVNPLHAAVPVAPLEPSPYLPATRRFRHPIYLRVDEVPGYEPATDEAERVAAANSTELIERDQVWALKEEALRAAYARSSPQPQEGLPGLEDYATWCALVGEHGPDWRTWPAELGGPGQPAVARYREEHPAEVGYHAWLQGLLEDQLRGATGDLTVIQDLPVGISGGGFDAWAWQDLLATEATVGAPPDKLNSLGQDWGSPPFVPWRLRAADYEPFIQSIRSTIAGAGGLRIDHVMGLFRLWWVPAGADASEGGYVHYRSDDLLDIVALESHRARAVIVGEDLGTVEASVSKALAERDILSYKVLWFEDEPAEEWPQAALATVTTHDLPTVAGLWSGADAKAQLAATEMSPEDVQHSQDELLARIPSANLVPGAGAEEAALAAYGALAEAPCLLISLSLEDAVLEERRPNIPGTTVRSNWSVPLAVEVDQLPELPTAQALVRLVGGRST